VPNKRLRIKVLVGGPSSEHEVSLKSGEQVLKNLNPERYEAERVLIDKYGFWQKSPEEIKKDTDLVFIAMHGTYGEDGTVQSMLDAVKLLYTGSSAPVSALAMNKFVTARTASYHGLFTPLSFLISENEWATRPVEVWRRVGPFLHFPVVVKPNNQGSSVGVVIAKNKEEAEKAMEEIFKITNEALIQQFIRGRELTVGVLDYGWPGSEYALPPTEIKPKTNHFFDYRAKYEIGASEEITPAHLGEAVTRLVQSAAKQLHKAVGAKGFSRTDIILDEKNQPFILEINTIPGLTETSLLPQQASEAGVSFSELLDRIIDASLGIKKHHL
jgi:D-alanine-D-alanine ligase